MALPRRAVDGLFEGRAVRLVDEVDEPVHLDLTGLARGKSQDAVQLVGPVDVPGPGVPLPTPHAGDLLCPCQAGLALAQGLFGAMQPFAGFGVVEGAQDRRRQAIQEACVFQQIVAGAGLHHLNRQHGVIPAGHHDERHGKPAVGDLLQDGHAGHVRQGIVEDDQGRDHGGEQFHGLQAVCRPDGFEAVLLEGGRCQFGKGDIVLNDEDGTSWPLHFEAIPSYTLSSCPRLTARTLVSLESIFSSAASRPCSPAARGRLPASRAARRW